VIAMIEIWKTIEGFERYQVSNFGRVKSFCWKFSKILKPQVNNWGYMLVSLSNQTEKNKRKTVHSLVLNAFKPKIEGKTYCNHIDGNKLNNYPHNLEWVTRMENLLLYFASDKAKNEWHFKPKPNRQFTAEDIKRIRKLRKYNVPARAIAKHYNTGHSTIFSIQKNKCYRDIK
jgi:hypothetical protein